MTASEVVLFKPSDESVAPPVNWEKAMGRHGARGLKLVWEYAWMVSERNRAFRPTVG